VQRIYLCQSLSEKLCENIRASRSSLSCNELQTKNLFVIYDISGLFDWLALFVAVLAGGFWVPACAGMTILRRNDIGGALRQAQYKQTRALRK
jgi:hypothetical protein